MQTLTRSKTPLGKKQYMKEDKRLQQQNSNANNARIIGKVKDY